MPDIQTPVIQAPVFAQAMSVAQVEKSPVHHMHKDLPINEINVALEEEFSEKRTEEELEQLFETSKKDSKKPSLVSRMLWGK